jgi:ubiquitin C-terminal hydrolase
MANYFKGFFNLGNTCYLNSGLQMLIQNKDLCNLIISHSSDNDILKNISVFINDYYYSNNTTLSPHYIKELVESKNSIFCGNGQNDAGEFVICLLDIISSELLKNNTENILYEIQNKHTVKCKLLKCLNVTTTIEKINLLFLDINKECKSLDDCYFNYKLRVKFENDNLYYCDKCQDKRIASKRLEIISFPKHLIIYLKRFEQSGSRLNKNNQELDIPLEWKHNYKLQGIIFHSGSRHGGHYIYIGKHFNKWFMFNDNSISEVHPSRLDFYKKYGYVLYYVMN